MTPYWTIRIYEQECAYDDYDTENGGGMPDDTEPTEVETIELQWNDDIQDALDGAGIGQWDGGDVAYDPDGSHMAPDGTITERWAVIDPDPSREMTRDEYRLEHAPDGMN